MTTLGRLINDLNLLCEKLDDEYCTNSGGCCFVAYLLMKHFERLHLKPILVIDNDREEIDDEEFLECVSNKTCNCQGLGCYTCCHYFVRVGDDFINGGEFCHDDIYEYDTLTSKDVQWIYKTGSWNSFYDRKHNPMVGRRIAQVFKKYEDLYKE